MPTTSLIDGVILLWFVEVALACAFVAIDIQRTPEAQVMKWGFVIVTLYSGPVGAVLYALSCREPLPGAHEAFVAEKWRQVVGSTMHCVAGDGIGILLAAAVTATLKLPMGLDLVAEYAAGFLFGWTIFQALFMKNIAGGSYQRALRATFLPELLSMNGVMGGMAAVMVPWMAHDPLAIEPTSPHFWFTMSIALTVGFMVAYPINWWLVDRGLKHGMMTVQPEGKSVPLAAGLAIAGYAMQTRPEIHQTAAGMQRGASHVMKGRFSRIDLALMTAMTFGVLAVGIAIAGFAGNLAPLSR